MFILSGLYKTVLDAIFPIAPAEEEVLALSGPQAFEALPRAKWSPMTLACSVFSYKDERVRHLIWAIKYRKSLPAATLAGHALFHILHSYSLSAFPIIVVPMPITKKRRRERGFNQCELIADAIEKLNGAESNKGRPILIVRDLLVRTQHKSRQTLKDRQERLESAKEIFAVNESVAAKFDLLRESPGKESDHLVLVIDDVITTGSTIKDAIMTLRAAGFEKTFGLSVAH